MVNMEKIKRSGHESDQHLVLKKAAESELLSDGFQVSMESDIGKACKVDVLGVNEKKRRPVIIECETLFDLQRKLLNTLQKAIIRHGEVELILCIPKFIPFTEIWCVNDTGKIEKFKKEVKEWSL